MAAVTGSTSSSRGGATASADVAEEEGAALWSVCTRLVKRPLPVSAVALNDSAFFKVEVGFLLVAWLLSSRSTSVADCVLRSFGALFGLELLLLPTPPLEAFLDDTVLECVDDDPCRRSVEPPPPPAATDPDIPLDRSENVFARFFTDPCLMELSLLTWSIFPAPLCFESVQPISTVTERKVTASDAWARSAAGGLAFKRVPGRYFLGTPRAALRPRCTSPIDRQRTPLSDNNSSVDVREVVRTVPLPSKELCVRRVQRRTMSRR